MSTQPILTKDAIIEWLDSQHTTLWGDWQITDLEGKAKAADWMIRQIESLALFINERHITDV